MEVAKAGKISGGKTEIPFEFPLQTKGNKVLYETYHGVFVNIQVSLKLKAQSHTERPQPAAAVASLELQLF